MLIGCPFEVFHIVRYIMMLQKYWFLVDSARRLVFLWQFVWCFCAVRYSVWAAAAAQVQVKTFFPSTGACVFENVKVKKPKQKR